MPNLQNFEGLQLTMPKGLNSLTDGKMISLFPPLLFIGNMPDFYNYPSPQRTNYLII